MLSVEAQRAEDRLRVAIEDARQYLTDEAVVWRAVAFSHDVGQEGLAVSPVARKRAGAAVEAVRRAAEAQPPSRIGTMQIPLPG